jgi:tetratricopeptide (TPR) repeat protein
MAPPAPLEKYERILAADPRSRIFVELAKALLDAGDAGRAAQVCERSIEHHPDSVQGRLVWGRALLRLGRQAEALARFEEAIARDPSSSYAYNLVGEALLEHGLARPARAILQRAAELHPGDARIRAWLEEARKAEPQGEAETATAMALAPLPDPLPALRGEGEEGETPNADATAPLPDPLPALRGEGAEGETATPTASSTPSVPPPLRRNGVPSTTAAPSDARGLLDLIPDAPAARPEPQHAAPAPPPGEIAAAAEEAARTYEHELREKLLAPESPPPPAVRRRHTVALVAAAAALALALAGAAYLTARAQRRAEEARNAVARATQGLARDTEGALREAARVLATAGTGPGRPDAAALAAEVNALLAHDFADPDARAVARGLLDSGAAGDGALATRALVAAEGEERNRAETALVENAAGGTPLVRALAGDVLLARRDHAAAREHLEAAARATPPLLRAVAALGDLELAQGAPERALERYDAALRAHATHPRSAIGAAEARLALGRELPEALRSLEAVEADAASTPPVALRLRFDLALARLLAASGRTGEAEKRLVAVAARHPERADVAAVQAEVLARAGDLDRALRAAQGASRLAPADAAYRELVARLQLQRGKYRDLLASTESAPTRTLRLDRGIARLALGDAAGSRTELEATRRDGKMPVEAAAWMALAELAAGRRAQAAAITDALLAAPNPHPLALVARARLDAAGQKLADAERHLREALARDPSLVEARVDLGAVLLDRGHAAEARDVLARAVADAPFRAGARRDLGRARLAMGDAAGAAQELEAALSQAPADGVALRALVEAAKAAGDPARARRAAMRAIEAEPRSAVAHLAAGEAAAAQGDVRTAREMLAAAVELGGARSEEAAEAKRALASVGKLPRK